MNKLESLLYLSEERGWAGGKDLFKSLRIKCRVPELNFAIFLNQLFLLLDSQLYWGR